MPIHEIRETLEMSDDVTVLEETDFLLIQKRIELNRGMRHTMVSVDFMDDSFLLPSDVTPRAYEVFLTAYPVIPTDMQLAETFPKRGPAASDSQVLFKQAQIHTGGSGAGVYTQRLPNDFLGTTPTYSWYTPHLYLTVILHIASDGPVWTIDDLCMSFYMAVESVEANAVEYGIGLLREYAENQARELVQNGIRINRANIDDGYFGWRNGGIRSELVTPTNIASATNFWLGLAYGNNSAEDALTATTIRAQLARARTAVGPNDAFGQGDNPDWFKVIARDLDGIVSGPLRDVFPPVVKNNNGNTECV